MSINDIWMKLTDFWPGASFSWSIPSTCSCSLRSAMASCHIISYDLYRMKDERTVPPYIQENSKNISVKLFHGLQDSKLTHSPWFNSSKPKEHVDLLRRVEETLYCVTWRLLLQLEIDNHHFNCYGENIHSLSWTPLVLSHPFQPFHSAILYHRWENQASHFWKKPKRATVTTSLLQPCGKKMAGALAVFSKRTPGPTPSPQPKQANRIPEESVASWTTPTPPNLTSRSETFLVLPLFFFQSPNAKI